MNLNYPGRTFSEIFSKDFQGTILKGLSVKYSGRLFSELFSKDFQ